MIQNNTSLMESSATGWRSGSDGQKSSGRTGSSCRAESQRRQVGRTWLNIN